MSWAQLQAIIDQTRGYLSQAAQEPPTACPIDGDILEVAEDGTRNCPMGNYRWP